MPSHTGDSKNKQDWHGMNTTNRRQRSILPYWIVSVLALVACVATLPSLAEQAGTQTAPGREPTAAPAPEATVALEPPTEVPIPGAESPLLPAGQAGLWELVFQDEFEGDVLDGSKWTTCYQWFDPAGGCTNEGNHELEWYLPQAVTVAGGSVTLRADQGVYTGTNGTAYPYTSGMIASGADPSTAPRFVYQYGFAEARLKLPAGKGLWPAFWLAPADGSWPPEVDIAERVGGTSPDKVEMVLHFALPQGGHDSSITEFVGPDFQAGWHIFGLQWTPDDLTWYIDGVARKHYTKVQNIPHTPMYLIVSLAILGQRPPDASVQFPAVLSVDYVRVWQEP
jgi:beta-glucanase (GH16 family)